MPKRTDIAASLVIGLLAGFLMLAIGRSVALPGGVRAILPWLPLSFPLITLAVMAVGAIVGQRLKTLYQLAKFLLVGGLNFLIDLGVLNLLIAATGISIGFYASVFKAVSFLVAMTSSFLWNKFWTFNSLATGEAGKQFAEFFAVTLIGFFINVGTFTLLNSAAGAVSGVDPRTWASIAAAGAAAAGLVWNFLGYKLLVFKKPQR